MMTTELWRELMRGRIAEIRRQRAIEHQASMELVFWGMFLACVVIVLGSLLLLLWGLG